jgi:hypothetical protein
MKKLYTILACACIATLTGCHTSAVTERTENASAFFILPSDSFFVSVQNLGKDGDIVYKNSAHELALMIKGNIAKHTKNVGVSTTPMSFEDAKAEAKKQGFKYLVSSEIIAWMEAPSGDTSLDKVKIKTTVWNLEKNAQQDSFTVSAKNPRVAFPSENPCFYARNAYAKYFNDLF